jgi:hypothetical protein
MIYLIQICFLLIYVRDNDSSISLAESKGAASYNA